MHFKKKAEKCQWQRAQSDQRYSTCQKDKAGPAYSVSSKWSKMAKNDQNFSQKFSQKLSWNCINIQ